MQQEKKLRAAVYARVSTDEQQRAETIENQLDFARRYAQLHGIEVVDWYRDEGVSGTLPLEERPEGRRLLQDARRRRFNLVLVYKVDRLARKTIHLLNAYEELEGLGIGLRSMTEAFDTSTPAGKFTMTMFASIAALERDTLLERTALGRSRRVRQGKWPGGLPPLGYRVGADGRLEIEPQEAEIVRTIFRLYTEEKMSTVAIADYLNGRNIPVAATLKGSGKREGRWRAARISYILSNPTYRGAHSVELRPSPGASEKIQTEVPPIIDEETWFKAEALRRQNKKKALRNSKRLYLLRGLIRCGHCGSPYAGDGRQDRSYSYYRCMGNANVNRSLKERCPATAIRAEGLEKLVWEDICSFIQNPGPLIKRLEARLRQEMASYRGVEEEMASLAQEISNKASERQRVINLYRRGLISETEAEVELTALEKEVAALKQRQEILLARQQQRQELETRITSAQILLERLRDKLENPSWEAKRELVEALVEGIIVDTVVENGKRMARVTIRYRFEDKNTDCSMNVFHPDNITDGAHFTHHTGHYSK